MHCFIIAEIGVNHNGSLDLAKRLIIEAKDSQADAVKFQTFSAERLASLKTPKVAYQKLGSDEAQSHFEMLKSLQLSAEDHIALKIFCDNAGIEFMSTPYDVDSARFLNEVVGIKRFKTASADVVDSLLHKYIRQTGKPVIISTGMATLGEIEKAMMIYEESGKDLVTLLHCTSNYPCRDNSVNMMVLETLQKTFGVEVGYSDHTVGSTAAVVAAACGAKVIEKHFTLDKDMIGPDHKASADPEELKILIKDVRTAEEMLGNGRKKIQPEEIEMRSISRKSLRAVRRIEKGEVITLKDIVLRRPGDGLYGNELEQVVGKQARRDIEEDELVMPNSVE